MFDFAGESEAEEIAKTQFVLGHSALIYSLFLEFEMVVLGFWLVLHFS